MKNRRLPILLVIALVAVSARAQARRSFAGPESAHAASLQELVNDAARTALSKFAAHKLTQEQLSITLIDLRDPNHPVIASFRGNERVYPASVVKLFYLGAVHRWLEDKKIQETDELKRAVRDMIVDSSNEATDRKS